MIEPTVGRVVWYRPGVADKLKIDTAQPFAAIVCHVHSDRMVNLVVFDANGRPNPMTSVTLVQEGDATPQSSYCEWMPYQLGQAKKNA